MSKMMLQPVLLCIAEVKKKEKKEKQVDLEKN